MSITIRPLEVHDREAWNPLWQGYLEFYESADVISDEQTNHLWSVLTGQTDEIMAFGAFDENEKMIGFTHYLYHQTTWFKEGYCYLEDLFVSPSIRGGGVGEKLINAVKEQAKADGRAKVYWQTQHFNFRARGLYHKLAGPSVPVVYEIDLT
ncbi:GNAT family N-acetyltransferase [Curvivirga aplysinae]|uniref:GNAT family N-acetyltransferase n=1 Tax=Curvivirga aplysinae TaxID=2529852 RepID=UPI0012BC195C|nr:GNAT family N-acetyltransferase [Curvivirga aplysinae]MTI08460.1 GNAT family N-acetyltransferase [Curvivirga aplysinae]